MAIPTEHDRKLGEIADLAALVLLKLRVLHRTGKVQGDVREALDQYCEAVRTLAGLKE